MATPRMLSTERNRPWQRFPVGVVWSDQVGITVRDADFIGEDKSLARELARRMSAPAPDFTLHAPEGIEPVYLHKSISYNNETADARKRKDGTYIQVPTEAHVIAMTMKMMEQACYSVQYRLKEIDQTIRKYSQDPRFRLAYMFKQVEEWEYDIMLAYTYASSRKRKETARFRVYRHLVYYSHCVRKMIDVTYTVEYLLELHQHILDTYTL